MRLLEILMGKKKAGRVLSPFHEVGFHGDMHLLALVRHCLENSEQFIETGANVGSSLHYVARAFPALTCYSCEPDPNAFAFARDKVSSLSNVQLLNCPSPDLLYRIADTDSAILDRDTVFWLDAHGYGFEWPLRDEVAFITERFKRGYLFIDDFHVPGIDAFAWDIYRTHRCEFDYIRGSIHHGLDFALYYPAYTDHTSPHHPLTGWGLIEFGHAAPFVIPDALRDKVTRAR